MSESEKNKDLIRESYVTYNEYADMPDDGNRYEIVDGTLQLMIPGPNTVHQRILRNLTSVFLQTCGRSGEFFFAPFDVILSPGNVRQPDLVFISNENKGIITERGIEGTPDLVAEILSPSSAKTDKTDKRETYERFGVKEYWIVDPQYEMLEQLILREKKYVLHHVYKPEEIVTSPLLACVSFQLAELLN